MNIEPYVKLLNGDDFQKLTSEDLIAINQSNRQSTKANFYKLAFDFIKENRIRGDYLEFGVHKARTFRMALSEARSQLLNDMKFWAFDSFEGLPESQTHQNQKWQKGALNTSLEEFKNILNEFDVYTDNIKYIKGFYSDVLTKSFIGNYIESNNQASFVTVDCDLYESALPVFNFLEYVVQPGAIIYIDDYFVGNKGDVSKGVARAFKEFAGVSRFNYVEFLSVGWWGKSYIVQE